MTFCHQGTVNGSRKDLDYSAVQISQKERLYSILDIEVTQAQCATILHFALSMCIVSFICTF